MSSRTIRDDLQTSIEDRGIYSIVEATPATGILYITANSPDFISGHVRLRGRHHGAYPYNYLEMIDQLFGEAEHTLETCSGWVKKSPKVFTVDINPNRNPDLVDDAQALQKINPYVFTRFRCDPPYNEDTANAMYGVAQLPSPVRLLAAGARVCTNGSLMFLLLGPKNYQICPKGLKRVGWIAMTIVPNNELRALHIYRKESEPDPQQLHLDVYPDVLL